MSATLKHMTFAGHDPKRAKLLLSPPPLPRACWDVYLSAQARRSSDAGHYVCSLGGTRAQCWLSSVRAGRVGGVVEERVEVAEPLGVGLGAHRHFAGGGPAEELLVLVPLHADVRQHHPELVGLGPVD